MLLWLLRVYHISSHDHFLRRSLHTFAMRPTASRPSHVRATSPTRTSTHTTSPSLHGWASTTRAPSSRMTTRSRHAILPSTARAASCLRRRPRRRLLQPLALLQLQPRLQPRQHPRAQRPALAAVRATARLRSERGTRSSSKVREREMGEGRVEGGREVWTRLGFETVYE